MAHAQKPDFVFRRKGRVHLSRRGRQFRQLLAAEVCASAVVMLDTPSSEVVKGTGYPLHSPVLLHFPSRASPCGVAFQLDSTDSDFLALRGVGAAKRPGHEADQPPACSADFKTE